MALLTIVVIGAGMFRIGKHPLVFTVNGVMLLEFMRGFVLFDGNQPLLHFF